MATTSEKALTDVQVECRFDAAFELLSIRVSGGTESDWTKPGTQKVPKRLALFVAWSVWRAGKAKVSLGNVEFPQELGPAGSVGKLSSKQAVKGDPVQLRGYLSTGGEVRWMAPTTGAWAKLIVVIGCSPACTSERCAEGSRCEKFECTNGGTCTGPDSWVSLSNLLKEHGLSPSEDAADLVKEDPPGLSKQSAVRFVRQLLTDTKLTLLAREIRGGTTDKKELSAEEITDWFYEYPSVEELLEASIDLYRRLDKPKRALVRPIALHVCTRFFTDTPSILELLELHAARQDRQRHQEEFPTKAMVREVSYFNSNDADVVPGARLNLSDALEVGPDVRARAAETRDNVVAKLPLETGRARDWLLTKHGMRGNLEEAQRDRLLAQALKRHFQRTGKRYYVAHGAAHGQQAGLASPAVAEALRGICALPDGGCYLSTFELPALTNEREVEVGNAVLSLAEFLFETTDEDKAP